jgi:uncharacterized phage-like protein YoqJ
MSEKRYIIVSASHHKKPRAMFLSAPANGAEYVWKQGIDKALLFTLSYARILAKENPIGMYFVEHTEAMQSVYDKAEQGKTYFDDFTGYAKHFGYEFICDWRQSENANLLGEPQENERCYALYSKSADGSIKYFCDKDAGTVALHKGQRVQIFTQSEAHELQHLPYTDEANADVWNVENIGLWNLGEPQETPEAKKRVVYVLRRPEGTGEAFYYCGKYPDLVISIGGKNVKAFRTQEEAEFAKDILDFDWVIDTVEVKIIK